jgi:hypothetical protein
MEDCVNRLVEDAVVCQRCLADDLLRAEVQGDENEVVRLQYLMHLVEGVLTVATTTVTMH